MQCKLHGSMANAKQTLYAYLRNYWKILGTTDHCVHWTYLKNIETVIRRIFTEIK